MDAITLAFGPAAAPPAHRNSPHLKDANGDDADDPLAHLLTEEAGIAFDTEARVTGELLDSTPFEDCDAITTRPRACGLGFELALVVPVLVSMRCKACG